MSSVPLTAHAPLQQLEVLLDRLAVALMAENADQLDQTCRELRDLSVHLARSGVAKQWAQSPEIRQRLALVAQRFAQSRELLAKRAAVVDMALQALVPTERASAYGKPTGAANAWAARPGSHTSIKA